MLLFQFFISGPSATPTPPTPDTTTATGAPVWWWVAMELARKRRKKRLLELEATKEGEAERVTPKPPGKRNPPPTPAKRVVPKRSNQPSVNPPSQPVRMSRLAMLEDAVLFGLPTDDPFLDAIAVEVGADGDEVERMTRANVILSRLTNGRI